MHGLFVANEATKAQGGIEKKWGKAIAGAGWTAVPNILLEKCHALGLTTTDLAILLQIMKYWWQPDGIAFPAKATIARALNMDARTVQRRIAEMEKLGIVERKRRPGSNGTNEYHLDGLKKMLMPHAREAASQREQHRAQRQARQNAKKAKGA